jgi:opacity protein-like surface antigen
MNALSRRAISLLLLPLALTSMPAFAEAPLGLYLGGGINWAQVAVEDDDYRDYDCCYYYGPYDFDQGEEDTGFTVHAGYRFNPWIAAELAYLDAGQPEWDERYVYVRDLDDVFDTLVELDIQSVQLSGLAILPFANIWEVYLRGGVAYWTADAEQWLIGGEDGEVYTREVDDEGTNFLIGLGLGASPAPSWHVRIEYQSYWLEEDLLLVDGDASLDTLLVELQYRLGALR